jgi:hypothetical protein
VHQSLIALMKVVVVVVVGGGGLKGVDIC